MEKENRVKEVSFIKRIILSFGQMIKVTYYTLLFAGVGFVAGLIIAPTQTLQALEIIRNLLGG